MEELTEGVLLETVHELIGEYERLVDHVNESFDSFSNAYNEHVMKDVKNFAELRVGLKDVECRLDSIEKTLNLLVSAAEAEQDNDHE